MFLRKSCKCKAVALAIGLLAALPVQAITTEELVYDQVSKYVRGNEAADIAKDICDASYMYNVDPILVAAVFTTESHFNNSARSGVGAVGISQLMPSTAASLNVNPYNRKENIYGGVKYLGQMVARYSTWDNPFVYAEAAYNAGPGAVDRAGGVPHYRETQNYVRTVEQTRKEIWQIAGHEAAYRSYTGKHILDDKNAPIFPSLQEWHEEKLKEQQAAEKAKTVAAAKHVKKAKATAKTNAKQLANTNNRTVNTNTASSTLTNNTKSTPTPFVNSARIAQKHHLEDNTSEWGD